MGRRVKRSFTLIEITLCLGLVAILGSLVIFKASSLLSFYRKNSEVTELKEELFLTHCLSVAFNTDIDLVLEVTEKGLKMSRFTDEAVLEKRHLLSKTKFFPHLGEELQNRYFVTYRGNAPGEKRPSIKIGDEIIAM